MISPEARVSLASIRETLRTARERVRAQEADPARRQRMRRADDDYVHRALSRRAVVRRLRLADGLPHELGGQAQPKTYLPAVAESLRATRDALGDLYGPGSQIIIDQLWAATP